MPVSKRHDSAPDAWWARFSVNGKRHQITIRAPNKRAAEALERDARRRAEAGAGRTQNSATVGAAFARYWQEHGQF